MKSYQLENVLTFNYISSPSLSHPENDLPRKFYEAELAGRQGNCLAYKDKCPVNILDLITRFD